MSDNETSSQLSDRELQVLEMVATGASNQEIAHQLVISVNTVKVHMRNIFEKLEVQSRTEAALRAIQEGWLEPPETAEETTVSAKTYLQNKGSQLALGQWQQIYLAIATVIALAVMIIPVIPAATPKVKPILPVIYAQPPTPVPANSAGSGSWVLQAPRPTKRAGLGLVALDGRIFAVGGVRANNKATRLVEIYDPGTDSWSEGAAKPTATANITGAVLDEKIYIPGGCTNTGEAIDSLEIYDPDTDSWTQGESLPEPRCGYGLIAFEDNLFLFGGWNGQAFEDTIFTFSSKENKWEILESSLPQAKGYMGMTSLGEEIYVVGGYDGQEEFNHTHIFRPEPGVWEEKTPMQEKRGGLGLISAANKLYAIGGGWNQPLTTSERYDPATNTWTTFETPFAHQWRNMGTTVLDTKIYVAGGWDSTEEKFIDSVASYQFLFQLFLPISNLKK